MIRTKSFELAANIKGDKNSERVAIVLPGRLDTKGYECFNAHLDLFAQKGYLAVCFDPPGSRDSLADRLLRGEKNLLD